MPIAWPSCYAMNFAEWPRMKKAASLIWPGRNQDFYWGGGTGNLHKPTHDKLSDVSILKK